MNFEERLQIGIDYSHFLAMGGVKIPHKVKERRKLFIRWYMEREKHLPFDKIINTLAKEVLYITTATLESIIFNEK